MTKTTYAAMIACCSVTISCAEDSTAPTPKTSAADLRELFYIQWSTPQGLPGAAGGHAFLLNYNMQRLALTAYHVAGPIDAQSQNPSSVSAWLVSPLDGSSIRLGARVPIDGAETINAASSQHDIAAFHVLDWDASRAFPLAPVLPDVGDTVYVLAFHQVDPLNPDPRGGPRKHPARVAVSHDSAFVYVYLASANSNFTSGAAVLDRHNQVVGINVGSLVSSTNTWTRFRDRYGQCCDGLVGGEVAGMAVHARTLARHFGFVPVSDNAAEVHQPGN